MKRLVLSPRISLAAPLLTVAALVVPVAVVHAAEIVITATTTINAGTTTYDNQDIVVRGATVTINGPHTFNSLRIENNGTVTHSPVGDPNYVDGLNLTVTQNLTILTGSKINATGKGYGSAQGPGAGVSDLIYGGGGAAYGGEGTRRYLSQGAGGSVYGSIQNPNEPGSGGGIGYGTEAGQPGGGLIRLVVGGTLNITGTIEANGNTAYLHGGAGSGGAISIQANVLTGAGAISTTGGVYYYAEGGAGGGGRIAIRYVDRSGFTGVVQSLGSNGSDTWAAAGTVFWKSNMQANGELVVDNANRDTTDDIYRPLSTIIANEETFDRVTIANRGRIAPPVGQVLKIHVVDRLFVDIGGRVSAEGRGYGPNQGPGAGGIVSNEGRGGAYGGDAIGRYIDQINNNVYGSVTDPNSEEQELTGTHLGSGGGAGNSGTGIGSYGGGGIRITVDGTARIDGTINASGLSQIQQWGGGGSGGSIYLKAMTLTGGGQILADSRPYRWNEGGVGSGGRIAIHYNDKSSFTGRVRATGRNSASTWSGPGTVYYKQTIQSYGDLVIDNDGNYTTNDQSYTPSAILTGAQTFDNVTVTGNGFLAPLPQQRLDLTVIGNCFVDGVIYADGRGYGRSLGPGAGGNNGTGGGGSGGSYGGRGGSKDGTVSGPTYGTPALVGDPFEQLFGSGGGYGIGDPVGRYGGLGGGALWLKVNGTLNVTGRIQANGKRGWQEGGAGSGGSILIRTGFLTGTGLITANGGQEWNQRNGGGGGRIALYTINSDLAPVNVRVTNGGGGSGVTDGTIYKETITGDATVSLSVSPSLLASGQTGAGSVNITAPAPANGLTIALTNSDPLALSIPPSVTIAQGQTAATFNYTAASVSAERTANITARLWDTSSTQTVTVKPYLRSIEFTPGSVIGGVSSVARLRLNTPAPAGGLAVSVVSNNTAAVPSPGIVTVPQGASTVTFNVPTNAVGSAQNVLLSATYLSEIATGRLYVNAGAAQLQSMVVSPTSVIAGSRVVGVVTLSTQAGIGGSVVTLASSSPDIAATPATVTVPAGKTSASYFINTFPVAGSQTVLLTGSLVQNKQAILTVALPTVSSLVLIPSTVVGGETSIGIVTIAAMSPTPVTVTITSNHGAAIPEATCIIPAGQTVGTFYIDTTAVTGTVSARITATANTGSKSQTLTVTP